MTEGEEIPERAKRRTVGPIEKAVKADLKLIDLKQPGKGSLAQLALLAARRLDALGDGAAMSTAAQYSRELRSTMVALTGGDDDDKKRILAEFARQLAAPVRDAAQPGAGDAGPEGGAG